MPVSRRPRGHSCVRCNRRKIKCDGTQPCSACRSASVICSARPPAKSRQGRMKLQKLSTPTVSNSNEAATDEILLEDEGHPRYFNEPLWGHLSKELPIVPTPRDVTQATTSTCPATSILWGPCEYQSIQSFRPAPSLAFQLWQIFLDNVNPLSKMIHAPSAQNIITEATRDQSRVSRGSEALMFSIYLCAVNSLKKSECETTLGESKNVLLQRYLTVTQQALVNAEFLQSSSLIVLQSLTLYLVCMRQHFDHKSLWLLTGLAVRSAQRIGLHKANGSSLISAFEAEMRHRLWWQILLVDSRAAQFAGLSLDIQMRDFFESRIPLNVNDCDIRPEMTSCPPDIETHSTEMLFCLVIYEAARFSTSLQHAEAQDMARIDEFRSSIQSKYLRFCDEAIPLHLLTKRLVQGLIAQISIKNFSNCKDNGTTNIPVTNRDAFFLWNIEVIECTNEIYSTECLQRYLWFLHGLFPIESFVNILVELQHRHQGVMVDRGWDAISNIYNTFMDTDWVPCSNPNDLLYCAVGKLALKAWQAHAIYRHPTPLWVTRLREKERAANNDPLENLLFSNVHEEIESGGAFEGAEDIFQNLHINWAL
ncbi:hypothetical protein BGW36DRAFT_352718 [Talaromyces proteolyticus]|uniref:Zn(2)-C6 fungal-type domain-containing protein n=1 Tax=Talaromyces proteolyticus TaxID=1131652 RepID=A0AAD4PTG2_9EURO|nr:uncharacterized protein BGW36DRAFT_352718 [Talaromyces proteolyticus]KAH8688713.1 hypothetical protein BGW36DRAFT_352718 [Talaromyces proteolyticus]